MDFLAPTRASLASLADSLRDWICSSEFRVARSSWICLAFSAASASSLTSMSWEILARITGRTSSSLRPSVEIFSSVPGSLSIDRIITMFFS